MLPSATITDDGTAAPGTVFGGAFTGPDVFQESGLTFLDITENVKLKDAIASLADGSAPADRHAYLIAVGDMQNVVGIVYSTQIPPNSNLRTVPGLTFKKGERIYIRAVQLSGSAAEVTYLTMMWGH